MNSTIGVYDTHEMAVEAVVKLKDAGYPVKQLSIVGKSDTEAVVDDKLHIISKDPINVKGLAAGTVAGTALGVLTGVGIFAIPGVGFLFGAGAIVGAIAGFDLGLIGGGIASVLTTMGVKDHNIKKYSDELNAGKFLVVAHGNHHDIDRAHAVLDEHGTHSDVAKH